MWRCRVLIVIICWEMVTAVSINYMRILNDVLPVKRQQIVLVCSISNFDNYVFIFKTDKPLTNASSHLCYCNQQECSPYDPRYNISSNTSGIYITVPSLDRIQDQKYWTCVFNQSIFTIQLLIYTPPQRIQYIDKPSVPTDLSLTSLTLKASTDCIFPKETITFTWYTNAPSGHRLSYPVQGVTNNTSSGCSDPLEKNYTSTLTLTGNTTFTNNTDVTVQFECGIDNTSLYTDLSVRVVFAVKVTNAALWNGNIIVTNNSMLTVANGSLSSLNCTASFSRPNAIMVWYVGQKEVQRGIVSTFTLPFTDSYHNRSIYCKAFNILENEAVESNRLMLYVVGTPFLVKNFMYLGNINEVPTFYMESGFNGGHQQQFIVETSIDGNVWTEKLRFNEYDSRFLQPNMTYIFGINALEAGTYKVRVIPSNIHGTAAQMEQSYIESFTIVARAAGLPTGAIAGGVAGGIIVIPLIAIAVFEWRTGRISKLINCRKPGFTYNKHEDTTIKVSCVYADIVPNSSSRPSHVYVSLAMDKRDRNTEPRSVEKHEKYANHTYDMALPIETSPVQVQPVIVKNENTYQNLKLQ